MNRIFLLCGLVLSAFPGCSEREPAPGHPTGDPPAHHAEAFPAAGVLDLIRLAHDNHPRAGEQLAEYHRTVAGAEKLLRSYNFDGRRPPAGWQVRKGAVRFEAHGGILHAETTAGDLQLTLTPDFDCSRVQRVRIRCRVSAGNRGRLFWMSRAEPRFGGDRSLQYWLNPGDGFHTYTMEVGDHEKWIGEITGLRLDPLDRPGAVEIESIEFLTGLNRREFDFLRARYGVPDAALELKTDRRRVLAVLPGEPHIFDLTLPRAPAGCQPELRFAIGLATAGPGLQAGSDSTVRFFIETGESGERIFDRVLDPGAGWEDCRVPLARFAGRMVRLILGVDSTVGTLDEGHIAVWANPLIHTVEGPERVNVLVVLVDTLRADRLSCYGHAERTSPHIDHLSRQGALFTNAVSASSWTAPAVASLFTGLYPYDHGVRYVDELELDGRLETVTERFRDAGYFTGAVSDNLLIVPGNGYAQGFRTFVSKPRRLLARKAAAVTDLALHWLATHGDQPFFLYLHYMDPHADYQPEPPFHPGTAHPGSRIRSFVEEGKSGTVATRLKNDEGFRLSAAEDQRLLDLYEGEISATDYHLGRLLAGLESGGLKERTVILFLADHGEEFADHGRYTHATSLFDELVRLPLLLRTPATCGEADSCMVDQVVRITDLAPTMLDLAGVEGFSSALDARSLGGLLRGEPESEEREAYCELSSHSRNPAAKGWVVTTRGLRYGDLKLLYEPRSRHYSLFDLVADPEEKRSLFQQGDIRSLEMVSRLERYLASAARAEESAAEAPLLEDRQLRQLDALGYLGE